MTACAEVTGIDGAGKSTVVAAVAERLGWRARKVQPFTPEVMARVVDARAALGERAADVVRSAALGMELLRHTDAAVVPTVYDRYLESARMWWHVKELPSVPADVLTLLPAPSVVVLLDLDPATGIARRHGTTEVSAAAEGRFLGACAAYLRAAAAAGGWVVIDAGQPLDRVIDEAVTAVEAATVRSSR